MTDTADFRSQCPVASTLDLVGDKWSLVVVRGFFVGHSRYGDWLKDGERISTNILANRLNRLESAKLIERYLADSADAHHQYRLTRKGADLLPVLQAMARWGFANIADRWAPPEWFLKAKPSDYYPKADQRPSHPRRFHA